MAPLFQVGVPSLQNRDCCWLSEWGSHWAARNGEKSGTKDTVDQHLRIMSSLLRHEHCESIL